MDKKAQFQISFGWLFAIIVGIFILALAIYFSVRFINLGQQASGAQSVSEISILLNPLETSFESSRVSSLEFPQETRIKNICNSNSNFGTQTLGLAQKSFGSFQDIETQRSVQNKYIFSNDTIEGKNFYLFSKRFDMPFEVASIIYLTSTETDYCFVNSPERVEEEIFSLNQSNIQLTNILGSCEAKSISVCFDYGTSCNVNVDSFSKSVTKDGIEGIEQTYYETDALMYAAIFSNEDIYECQVKRLMQRLKFLSLLYEEKANVLFEKGCTIEVNPSNLANDADSVSNSETLFNVKNTAENLDLVNRRARCELW